MLAVLFLPLALNAQLSAVYQFTTGIDNTQWYTLTSDSTVLKVGSGNDGYASPVTNIGFTFNFAGVDYTQFSANSDGTVRLGGTAVGTGNYTNPFSSTNANNNNPKICGLGCDGYLVAATADSPADYIAYQLFGSEGDHVLVIEISTGTYNSSTRNNHYTFQIQLAEANNSVTLMYSPIAPAAGPAVTYQIGACTGASDIVLFNVANNTMSTYTAGTSTTNASGTWPAPGRYYTITPNPNPCYPVSGLTATNITTTGTTLTWADTNNTGATYSVYNGETLLASGISGNTYDITGLAANTSYVFNVVTSCSGDNESNAANVSIRTACGLTSLPWTCSFEESEIVNTTQATALPWCTQRYSAPSSVTNPNYPYAYNSSTYAHTGSRSLYFYGTTGSAYPDTMAIILPEIDVTNYPMSNSRITFWARMGSASNTKNAYIGSMTDPNDISTFTVIDNVTVSGTTQTKFSVPLANATGSYIVIMVPKGTGSLYMDDVTIEELPSCLEVSNITTPNITSSSVTLNWVDASNNGATYTIYDMADTSVVGTANDTTYTVDNLAANTTYTFGVQANCTSGDAPIMTVSVLTACISETMPWSENFDDWTAKSSCWSFLSGAFSGTPTPSTSAWTLNTSYGSYINISGKALTMNVYSTYRYWAVTPPIVITNDNAMLSVDVAVSAWSAATPNYDADDTLAFAISTDGGTTFTPLLVFDNTQINTLGNSYTTIFVPVTGYDGQTVRFAIFAGSTASGGDNRIVIDNVAVGEPISCLPVTNLSASNVTAFEATLSWVGDADNYTIYDMADTTVVGSTSDATYTIDNLTSNTTYTFGVQANCTSGDAPIVIVTLTTGCATETMPWSENFDNWSSKSPCWSFLSGAFSGTPTPSTSAWTLNSSYGSHINIAGKALTMNVYSTYRYWAVTPPIAISNDNAMLSVDVAVAAWSAATPNYDADDTLAFAITTDDGATYTTLLVYDDTLLNSLGNDYTTIYIPVNGYNGQTVRFAIFAGSTASGGDNRIVIDNVTVGEPVTCMPVTGLTATNITETGATLTWNGDATNYNVYDMSDSTFVTSVNTTSYDLTGLTAMTSYTYGIAADCGGDESPIVTVTFTTACSALTLPYTETFEANSNAVGCWTVAGDGSWGIGVGDYSTSTGAYEGSYNAKITHDVTGNTTMLISPVLDGVQAGLTLDFAYVMRQWVNDLDELRVYSRTAADAAWQQVAEYTTEAATWTTSTVVIPGTVYQIAFEHTDNYGYGIGLDSIVFTAISGDFCYAVSNLTASNATASSVTLSWSDDNNSGATYTIYNMADNTVIATGVTTTSYDVTGLASLTGYTFGVVANCSATDESSVVTVDAVTACSGATCNITIVGNDSFGDGWNGNAIEISQNGTIIGTFTLADDSTLTETFTVCSEAPVSFSWVEGNYATETSFEIFDGSDSSVFVGTGANMTAGTFLTLNNACPSTPIVDMLHVTLTINDATLGTITPAVGNYDLALGDTLMLTATPNADANFDGWRMIVGGQAIATLPMNPYSMVVNANILSLGSLTVMAMFSDSTSAPDSMTIIVNTADPTMGTTDPAPGIHNYAVGEQSIITALPNPGYEFLYWVESATIAGMTMTDTIYNATVGLVVPPVYAGVTLNITAYFQVAQGEPCDAPTGVSVSAFDDQSISLVWDDNTNAESWNIRYRSQNSDWTTVVANTNNYTITGLTPNTTYQMQVQTNCGDNLSQWSATITQTTTGLNSYLENNISLYPNPANDYIDVRVDELNVTSMEVYDVYGKLINTVNVVNNPTRINVSGLATGMYFVRVTTEQGVVTKSFIKK